MDILSYLQNNNITVGEENFYNRYTYSNDEELIKKQIDVFIELQELLKKQKSTIIPRIESTIGKELENFKVGIRKNNKNLTLLVNNKAMTSLDKYILNEGNKIINRANRALDKILQDDYIELIKRSMNNYEICLGRVDESNIRVNFEGKINIRTIKYISYNLIEHDIYNYIKKLKKRKYEGDFEQLIDYFIYNAGLTNKSLEYIKALINYPTEEIKLLTKYFLQSNTKTANQWIDEMNLAIKNDGKELG